MAESGPEVTRLEESLRQCRLELAGLREQQEGWAEQDAELQRTGAALAELARHLDERLTRTEATSGGLRGWAKRRLVPTLPTPEEEADVARLRGSALFDGAWYLSTYPEVAGTGLSPALHYLRHGAGEGKDPGPDFSTRRHLTRHPRAGTNPLLHHLDGLDGPDGPDGPEGPDPDLPAR